MLILDSMLLYWDSFSLSAPTWTQVVKIDTQFQIKKKTQKPRKAAFFEATQSV